MPVQAGCGRALTTTWRSRAKAIANYVGSELGVEGALRRDEANHVYDFDQYMQAQWDPLASWHVVAGVRNSQREGHFAWSFGGARRRDSSLRYSAVNPVAGMTYRAAPAVNVYGSYGKGFETPTLNDLAYRSINGSLPGLNTSLEAARSDNFEVGVKAGTGAGARRPRCVLHQDDKTNWRCCRTRAAGQWIRTSAKRRAVERNWGLDAQWGGDFSDRGWPTRTSGRWLRRATTPALAAPCRPPALSITAAVAAPTTSWWPPGVICRRFPRMRCMPG